MWASCYSTSLVRISGLLMSLGQFMVSIVYLVSLLKFSSAPFSEVTTAQLIRALHSASQEGNAISLSNFKFDFHWNPGHQFPPSKIHRETHWPDSLYNPLNSNPSTDCTDLQTSEPSNVNQQHCFTAVTTVSFLMKCKEIKIKLGQINIIPSIHKEKKSIRTYLKKKKKSNKSQNK